MAIRLGVVGLGESWERRHKPALLRMSDKFEIRAVYDEVAHRTRSQASELECDAADGFHCLIERDDVDAVYILGRSWAGIEPVRAACRTKKPIFLGRLFAPDTPYADEVIDAIESTGVRFLAELPWRFLPATIRLMELLASGLGAPQWATCDHLVLVPDQSASPLARQDADGSEIGLYMADWLRFVFGRDPVRTSAVAECKFERGPTRSMETMVAWFEDSSVGQATVRRFVQPHWTEAARFQRPPGFQVVSEHGVAFLEMPGTITWFDQSGRHDETLEMEKSLGEMLADRFFRVVVHGLNPSPGLNDARWARNMLRQARERLGAPLPEAAEPEPPRTSG